MSQKCNVRAQCTHKQQAQLSFTMSRALMTSRERHAEKLPWFWSFPLCLGTGRWTCVRSRGRRACRRLVGPASWRRAPAGWAGTTRCLTTAPPLPAWCSSASRRTGRGTVALCQNNARTWKAILEAFWPVRKCQQYIHVKFRKTRSSTWVT